MFDLGILAQPVAADPPCGSDLDLEGDVQYLNYFAGVESKFPKSYFEVKDANGELKRFDSKSIDAEQLFETAKPLFSRTRDLRLLILLAKVSILARDLASFVRLVEAVALLLETEWENVHPKGEGGDFSYRGVMIESIDALPTVINPLQFLPLVENRRHGTISYRVIQIVSGEIAVGENEVVPDLTAIDRIIEEADLAPLKATSASFVQLATAIDRIGAIWSERSGSDQSLSVDRLSKTTAAIVAWLRQAIVQRDPDAVPAEAEADATSVDAEGRPEIAPAVGGKISSTAAAAAALVAIATYFAGTEPSNPALLLVRQAQQMIGKSFVEVIQILVPLHAETAVIHVGKQQTFDLPISPMAHLLDTGESFAPHPGDSQDIVFSVENRTQALALMEKVAAYFRQAEPSNPVPFLIDKAKEMAQRDFLALLRDVLPEGALKTLDT